VKPFSSFVLKTKLKHAIFDFDDTLTVSNVFAALANSNTTATHVPAPHARTELGQLARLNQLESEWGTGVFATSVFGGISRLERLERLFVDLRAADVECIILSVVLVALCEDVFSRLGS
jgi:hypothetical protein